MTGRTCSRAGWMSPFRASSKQASSPAPTRRWSSRSRRCQQPAAVVHRAPGRPRVAQLHEQLDAHKARGRLLQVPQREMGHPGSGLMYRTGIRRRAEVRRRAPAGTGQRPIGRPNPADGGPGRGSASAQGPGTWRGPAGSSHHRPTRRRHLARGFANEGLIPNRCRGPARHLEPRRSSQLSQVSESGFLREGTRLRRVEGVRQARARKGCRACLVGLRRSLARHLSRRESDAA